jgi:hypothetical protein
MKYICFLAAAGAITLVASPATAQSVAPEELTRDPPPTDFVKDRVIRVDADLASAIGTWSGTAGCSDPKRASNALKAAFDRWIGQQAQAHPGQLLLTYGWTEANWWSWVKRKPWPSNARYCKGGYRSVKVYARFY